MPHQNHNLLQSQLEQKFTTGDKLNLKLPFNLSALAYLAWHLKTDQFTDGIFWFVNDHREREQAAKLLTFWQHQLNHASAFCLFPEDFYKFQAAVNPRGLILGANDHLSLPLPEPKVLQSCLLQLKVGEKISPTNFLKLLTNLGYVTGPLSDNGGWYQKRGGFIDLAMNTAELIEIEFTANNISGLVKKSLITNQRTPIKKLTVIPLQLKPASYINIVDYLTDKCLLFCPTNIIAQHLDNKLVQQLTANPFTEGQVWIESTPLFGGRWEEVQHFIQQEIINGFKVIILTREPIRTGRYLGKLATTCQIITVDEETGPLLTGFRNYLDKVTFLTDRNLAWQQRTWGSNYVYLPLNHLKRNDYLVHIDHGIGRFLSLSSEGIDGAKHDYFVVEYAENDKLYVPVENADRLSRYIGQPHPKLHRLHGSGWSQITKKIKEEAGVVARELLELYAKRTVAKMTPWQPYAEEQELSDNFPWPLTSDQLKAWAEISADLERELPMDRLICGDVGFGKTELAVRASFRAVLNRKQVALLAPTTLLAQQHFDTFSKRLSRWPVKVALLSRIQEPTVAKKTVTQIARGDIDVIIGTHRLLSKDINIPNLGLLIVDEEQRFGVKQKEVLKKLKPSLHVLSLSATPIPRTLHLALSEIRDLSMITTPPWGRLPINTIFTPYDPQVIKEAVTRELKRQGQVYYLVNRIAKIPATLMRLQQILPKIKIGVAHGRLPEKDLAKIMHDFDTQKIDLLLATTIIENGLDLPNVNTLIVEDAETFGLADLYQLRGRVGRNDRQAFAYFCFNQKTSSPMAQKRLAVLAEAKELGSGLQVALKDMELRGAGSILGIEQHGEIAAVGLHLYSRLIAQAIEELRTGLPLPEVPEVTLRLPLEGRVSPDLIPEENERIKLYHRLANIRSRDELKNLPEIIFNRPLKDTTEDKLLDNLLTLLELKLLAETARLTEVSYHHQNGVGRFEIKFAQQTTAESLAQLLTCDPTWKFSTDVLRAEYSITNKDWVTWLKRSLELLGK